MSDTEPKLKPLVWTPEPIDDAYLINRLAYHHRIDPADIGEVSTEELKNQLIRRDGKLIFKLWDDIRQRGDMIGSLVSEVKEYRKKLEPIQLPHESLDDVINRLIKESEEVEKYIHSYVASKNGECVYETILGHVVIANHSFVDDMCEKCGISLPIKPYCVGTDEENKSYENLIADGIIAPPKIPDRCPPTSQTPSEDAYC